MVVLSASVTGRIVALPNPNSMIASKIRIKDSDTGFVFKVHIPDSLSRFTYQIRIHDSHTRFVFKLMPSSMNECMPGGAMQGFFSVAYEGCPFDALCRVSFRGNMLRSYQGPMRGVLPGGRCRVSFRDLCGVSFREPQQGLRPGQMSSLFMKFTLHANPHYRYL